MNYWDNRQQNWWLKLFQGNHWMKWKAILISLDYYYKLKTTFFIQLNYYKLVFHIECWGNSEYPCLRKLRRSLALGNSWWNNTVLIIGDTAHIWCKSCETSPHQVFNTKKLFWNTRTFCFRRFIRALAAIWT